jgi:uncharacterized protein
MDSQMNSTALNNDELDYLDDLLQSCGNDASILDVNELDGFFTALVVSPAAAPMSQWYPAIWGGPGLEPELESEEEAEQVEQLLNRMFDSLHEQLAQAPEDFTALFYEGEFQGQTVTVVEEWCFGFMRGVQLAGWPALPAEQASLLDAIALHGDETHFPKLEQMSLDQHQESINAIEPAVRALYVWFHKGS